MTEEKIMLNGIGIHVRYSLNDGQAILFLHFGSANLNMWESILPQFEADYGVIAPDLRGHGRSDKPLTGYHIDDMANDMCLLLAHLNVARCHIVGCSLGAEVALSIAASHPELVLSLVCDGAFYNEFGEYGLFNGTDLEIARQKEALCGRLAKRRELSFATREAYVEQERANLAPLGIWNDSFRPLFENCVQPAENGGFALCYPAYARAEYTQLYWDLKFERYYKKLKSPVLLLPDREIWEDAAKRRILRALAALPELCEIRYIENSIHPFVWIQMPSESGEAVKEFIVRHASAPQTIRN